jgi:hypothetical protein
MSHHRKCLTATGALLLALTVGYGAITLEAASPGSMRASSPILAAATANEMDIEFMGLCAYLMDKNERRVTVLLPVNSAHPHKPQLIVRLADLVNPDDAKFFKQIGPFGWIDLAPQTDIDIRPGGEPPRINQLQVKAPQSKEKLCPEDSNRNNAGWLVDLNDLTGATSRADLDLANRFPNGVAARCFLRTGGLQVTGHARQRGKIQRLQFDGSTWGNTSRAIADSATYSVASPKKNVVIDLDAPGDENDRVLNFSTPAEIYIANSPMDDKGNEAEHFDAFYDLLSKTDLRPRLKIDAANECPAEQPGKVKKYPPKKICPQIAIWKP